ncbi:MAG TPA: beta-ketoacyl-ACP synthase 3, partial [Burkholderiales bacterium]|nr:beta-ketoacyl-ACP synthase 3 [Burkholderiales bacterium]
MYSRIAGSGSYLPEKILTNRDLEALVDTSDEWIFARTGIRQRHIAAEDEKASDLALHASKNAMRAAHVAPGDIDLIIVATSTPDMIFPSTACILQAKLGIKNCPAFDLQAVCSGFVYALATADLFIRFGQSHCALVVGTEVYSRILDWSDRGTCVLFGDGAGAIIAKPSKTPGIISTHLHADGSYHKVLAVPGSVSNGKVVGNPHVVM